MNSNNHIDRIIINSCSSSSTDSLEENDDVDNLLKALVPNAEFNEQSHSKSKREDAIVISINRIENIRKDVSQIKDISKLLEKTIKQYELSIDTDQRLSLQNRIASIIQHGNSIAASSRFSIQTLKLEYNDKLRCNDSATTYNLFSQSYHSIAHSFIESITEYQKLQQQYEQLLEKNYSLPSFLDEEENDHIPQKQQIILGETVHHQLVEACIESQTQYREIEMIQKSMKEIQQLFFDLALLVDEQSEMLDYVQINIDTTNDRTDRTEAALQNTIKRMKKMRKLKCCILITIIILLLIAGLSAVLFAKSII